MSEIKNPHRIVDGEEQKYCCRCGQWKPVTGFHKCWPAWDGLQSKCKDCQREIERIYKRIGQKGRRGPTVKHVTLEDGTVAKKCLQCDTVKPLSEFNKWKVHWDGLSTACRACQSVANKRRYKRSCMEKFDKLQKLKLIN